MAKRQAGTELNHENWDQDEDQEQAGIFKKATETEIAGRVIKKAARKRVNPMAASGGVGGEEKKNAFASFGGFAAPTPSAGGGSDAFGFLKKGVTDSPASTGPISFGSTAANTSSFSFGSSSKTEPAKSAGFSFGTSNASTNSTSSSFAFGSSNTTKEPAKAGFAFGSPATSNKDSAVGSPFSFGSSSTTSTDASKSAGFVFGSSMAAKPTAAAQPTAASGFSFGSKESTPVAAAKKEEAVVKPVFGSPPAANGSSATTTGPATASAPKEDLMAMFKPKTGTWSCDVCMISNPSEKIKCAACETPKPGSKPEANGASNTTSVFGTSASSGAFKFGASGVDSGGGGFKFGSGGGSSTTSTTSAPSPVSGFKFGSSSTNAPVASKTESKSTSSFAFGDQKPAVATPEKKESSAFKINAAETKPSPGFSFGASSTPVNKPVNTSFGDKFSSPSAAINKDSSSKFSSGSDSVPAVKPTASAFSFGAKADNSNSSDSSSSKSNMAGFASTFGGTKSTPSQEAGETEYNEDFLAHLQALNKQVTQWIQKHINENSYVILSPVFKDYEKHLKEITEKFPANKKSSAAINSSFSSTSPSASAKLTSATSFMPSSSSAPKFGLSASATSPVNSAVKPFSFGSSTETSTPLATTKTEAVKPFSFGSTPSAESKTEAVKPFSFGSTSDKSAAPASGGFSFGMGAANPPAPAAPGGGFSFGPGMFAAPPGAGAINAPSAGDGAKEDDYEPPKAEVTTVEESDALYSKKCKLFYKKDGSYVEKGVGMLHLKSADNGKTQLVIRADTNLGNILLNIILNKDIPTTRVGKNNVMLVCIPNPPINPKEGGNEPVGMLIRVKSGDDADELKTKLDDYKSK